MTLFARCTRTTESPNFVLQSSTLPRKVDSMPTSTEAEEHLRVIRSLMEKATSYRAVSAPAAAIGGILAVAASFAMGNWWPLGRGGGVGEKAIEPLHFLFVWLGVLAVTGAVNIYFLWRDSQKRGDVFVSARMKTALMALLPSYIVAIFCTVLLICSSLPNLVVPVWITCHGLALLGTSHFAPRSLVILGWAFMITGLLSIVPVVHANWPMLGESPIENATPAGQIWMRNSGLLTSQFWMAGTFGLFHLIYAACTWPRKTGGEV